MRTADIRRDTRETRIQLSLNLDGTGKADIATGVGFLDHMLELFARHGDFDLTIRCQGDTQVDGHHSVEDIGICLGRAFAEALGDKRGITRYGQFLLPMDETLVLVACDLSGRTIWAGPWICPPKGGGLRYGAGQGVLPGLRPGVPHVPPHPADGRGEHPPHSGGRVQGRGPGLEDGCGPGRKTPG